MRRAAISWCLNLCYLVAITLAAPWIVWSMFFRGKYREGLGQKLLGRVSPRKDGQGCIWLHAVSMGEVNILRTLVAQLEDRYPNARLWISSTTKTGFDLARRRFGHHNVFYCPLDFTWAVKRALRRIRPDLLVLAELELWPNLILTARQRGTAIAIVNGRLSDNSYRGYLRIRWLIAGVLRHVQLIGAQDQATADRFVRLGAVPGAVHVTGSLKYDGAEINRDNSATNNLREIARLTPTDVVFLAGSTQSPEEQLALEAYRSLVGEFPHLRLIIVPRHPQRFEEVAELLADSGLPWALRSQISDKHPPHDECEEAAKGEPPSVVSNARSGRADSSRPPICSVGTGKARPILLVDTVGELAAWWGTADIAFVGGSLGSRGGQNMIEPAAYGAAVCFGPNTGNFRDVVRTLLAAEAACVVEDGDALTRFVRRCLTSDGYAPELGRRAQEVVTSQLGATARTISLLQPHVPPSDGSVAASRPAA